MNKTTKILTQASGTQTSSTFYPQLLETIKGILKVEYALVTDATITFTLEGRMDTTDEWVTVITIDQTEGGTTLLAALTFIKEFDLMPQMRLTVTNVNAATLSSAWGMEY